MQYNVFMSQCLNEIWAFEDAGTIKGLGRIDGIQFNLGHRGTSQLARPVFGFVPLS